MYVYDTGGVAYAELSAMLCLSLTGETVLDLTVMTSVAINRPNLHDKSY